MQSKDMNTRTSAATEILSREDLTNRVKEKAFSLGACLVGIAPISRFDGAPKEVHPQRLLPEVKTLVSMAYRINRGIQQLHLRGPSPMPFSRFAGLEPLNRLDDMALDLANFLEGLDHISLPIPANRYYFQEEGLGEISHRHAAMAAGLGRLGRGGFLVTAKFGGAVQLTTVLTTAALIPDSMVEEDPCQGCPQPCVSICPVEAISRERDRVVQMDGKEYRYGWLSYLRCLWGCGGLVMDHRSYALSDLPMPALDAEDDPVRVREEFLLMAQNRFPWDSANRAVSQYTACSKCYVVCHPEQMKKRKKESR